MRQPVNPDAPIKKGGLKAALFSAGQPLRYQSIF
jgi:hypothetical protein